MVNPDPALSPTEARVLQTLGRWPGDRLPPTLRELAAALGWRSAATAREYLVRLQGRGLVRLEPGRSRALRLTEAGQARLQPPPPLDRIPEGLEGAQAMMKLLAAHARAQTLPKGGFLWHEGDPADRLVWVEQGLLRAFRTFEDGRTTALLRFGPGDLLGFSPFFEDSGFPASVEALAPSRLLVVYRPDLEAALRDPRIGMALLALLARRLRKAFDTIERLSIRSALNRVASALEPLVPTGRYPIVALPGSARAFAESIGLTPASLSRALAALMRQGVLHRLGTGRYQVVQPEALRRLASGAESDRT